MYEIPAVFIDWLLRSKALTGNIIASEHMIKLGEFHSRFIENSSLFRTMKLAPNATSESPMLMIT